MTKPTKMSTANKPLPVLKFERSVQDDNNICVFETLEEYTFCAKPSRQKSNHSQLLLSHIELRSPVKTCTFFTCTLSRRICQVLNKLV